MGPPSPQVLTLPPVTAQLTKVTFAGNGSVTTRFAAAPALTFCATTVYVIVAPGATIEPEAGFADLVRLMAAGRFDRRRHLVRADPVLECQVVRKDSRVGQRHERRRCRIHRDLEGERRCRGTLFDVAAAQVVTGDAPMAPPENVVVRTRRRRDAGARPRERRQGRPPLRTRSGGWPCTSVCWYRYRLRDCQRSRCALFRPQRSRSMSASV